MTWNRMKLLVAAILFGSMVFRTEGVIISCTRWNSTISNLEPVERTTCRTEDGTAVHCDKPVLEDASQSAILPNTALFEAQSLESSQRFVVSHKAQILDGRPTLIGFEDGTRNRTELVGDVIEPSVEWNPVSILGFCRKPSSLPSIMLPFVGTPFGECCEPCNHRICLEKHRGRNGRKKRRMRCRRQGLQCCFPCDFLPVS